MAVTLNLNGHKGRQDTSLPKGFGAFSAIRILKCLGKIHYSTIQKCNNVTRTPGHKYLEERATSQEPRELVYRASSDQDYRTPLQDECKENLILCVGLRFFPVLRGGLNAK